MRIGVPVEHGQGERRVALTPDVAKRLHALGHSAPMLVTAGMVEAMKPGSVIVDLAAATGGNCELTRPGEAYVHRGVNLIGYTDLPSRKPHDASQMYARNVAALLGLLGPNGEIDFNDDILDQACVTYQGEIRHIRVRALTSS